MASLSARVGQLEAEHGALADRQAAVDRLLAERAALIAQVEGVDARITAAQAAVVASEAAGTVLTQLGHRFEAVLTQAPKAGPLPNVGLAEVRAYIARHPWQRPHEIAVGLGVSRNSVTRRLYDLVTRGEAQRVQARYAPAALPPILEEVQGPTQRDRVREYVAAHPGATVTEIRGALNLGRQVSAMCHTLMQRGEFIRQGEGYAAITVPPVKATTAPATPVAAPPPAAPLPVAPPLPTTPPARLSSDERAVFELVGQVAGGMSPRLVGSRLNWSASRTDRIVIPLLHAGVLLKSGDHLVPNPTYKEVPRHA